MPIFSRFMFQAVHWAARRGLREEEGSSADTRKNAARRTGVRGETYAYWYLRRHACSFERRSGFSRNAMLAIARAGLTFWRSTTGPDTTP